MLRASPILPRLRDVHNVDKPSPMLFVCLIFGGRIISLKEMEALDAKERETPESPLVSVSTPQMNGQGITNFFRYLVQIRREKGRP